VCDYKLHKKEKERVILTVGGDRLDYSGEVATSTADITTFKILINITLSTKDADMMMMYITTITLAHLWLGMNTCTCYCQDYRGNHHQDQLTRTICRRMGLHRNQEGNVRFETSRHPSQSAPTETSGPVWIISSLQLSWTLAAHNKTYSFLTHCGRFCSEVCGKIKYRAPKK
jgi:hypothetical protein